MSDRVMQKLDHLIVRVSHILLVSSGVLTLLMAWVTTYGVFRRYAFNAPEPYSYELGTMFLLFCAVLAVAGVERLDRNIRNDIISARFPPRMQDIIYKIIAPFLALLFSAILTWQSGNNALYALRIGQISNSPWGVPLAPIKFVIPIGYSLLCLVLIWKIYRGLALLKGSKNQNRIE